MILNPLVTYTLLGFLLVKLIAIVGAFASGKLGFNYAWLSIFSFAVYIMIGYLISSGASWIFALAGTCIIGIYDATVGWNLCLRFKARTGMSAEEQAALTDSKRISMMLVVAPVYFGELLMGHHC